MQKIRRSKIDNIPYGGIIPVINKLNQCKVPRIIQSCLGQRVKQSKFSYANVVLGWAVTTMCGGTRLDHISRYKKKLSKIPGLKIPSNDTLGRVLKSLANEVKVHHEQYKNGTLKFNIKTTYDDNLTLNAMLVKSTKAVGGFKENRKYCMDVDAVFIATEKRGAERKQDDQGKEHRKIGFNPMVALIDRKVCGVSMRNGTASPVFHFTEFIHNTLTVLEESNIQVGRFRSDAAGYKYETFKYLENRGIKFVVRFRVTKGMESLQKRMKGYYVWRPTEVETTNNSWNCQISSMPYTMQNTHYPTNPEERRTWRLVMMRRPTLEYLKINDPVEYERAIIITNKLTKLARNKKLKEVSKAYNDTHWKEFENYEYKFVITNDWEKTDEEIMIEYNKRGGAERNFSYLKRDMAWALPPFMEMNQNTVFILVSALASNLFLSIMEAFNKITKGFNTRSRLAKFINDFIMVDCRFDGGDYFEFDDDHPIAYELLM